MVYNFLRLVFEESRESDLTLGRITLIGSAFRFLGPISKQCWKLDSNLHQLLNNGICGQSLHSSKENCITVPFPMTKNVAFLKFCLCNWYSTHWITMLTNAVND